MRHSLNPNTQFLALVLLSVLAVASTAASAPDSFQVAQEQRVEILIKDSTFLLTQPASLQRGMSTVIILRNQDIIRHGFTSTVLGGLLVHGEGGGVVAYGKGVEGFYVDPNQTLVIRFATERPGSYTFRCDLHPQMKGELYLLEIPTA